MLNVMFSLSCFCIWKIAMKDSTKERYLRRVNGLPPDRDQVSWVILFIFILPYIDPVAMSESRLPLALIPVTIAPAVLALSLLLIIAVLALLGWKSLAPWKVLMSQLYFAFTSYLEPDCLQTYWPLPCLRPSTQSPSYLTKQHNNEKVVKLEVILMNFLSLVTCPHSATSWPRSRGPPCWPSPRHSTSSRARHRPDNWTPRPPRGSCLHWPRPGTKHHQHRQLDKP